MIYRSTFCKTHGVTVLDEDTRTLRLGAWRTVRPSVIEALQTLHGKRVVVEPIQQNSPEASLILSDPPGDRAPTPLPSEDRIHNLSAPEAILRRLLRDAVERSATDLSLWCIEGRRWSVSQRVAGDITTVAQIDATVAERIIQHLVLRSGLDPFDTESPQDGTLVFPWLPDHRIRIALIGDRESRSVALRFLRRRPPRLGDLGYSEAEITALLHGACEETGFLLFVGPTGSGKTTSIAALVAHLVEIDRRKFVSVEDPIEYRISGVVQIERVGSDLSSSVVSAALRQDPDVLVFGEIRTPDHAVEIERAILSGHTVITSVHADDADGAFLRLSDLGISKAVLRRYGLVVCSQRLIGTPRRLRTDISIRPWRDTR